MAEISSYESNLAISDETILAFDDELARFTGDSVIKLPEITSSINHDGQECTPGLDLMPGLYLADQYEFTNGDPLKEPIRLSFNVQPSHRLGREVSHNKVFFINLVSKTQNGSKVFIDEQVAVKPVQRAVPLLGELAMFQYLKEVNIPTFQPLGVLLTKNNPHYLLTRFQQKIDTMDTLDWKEMDYEEKLFQLRYAIDTAVLLHTKLLFHGDLEFKNVGFNEIGEIFVVDPEVMRSGLSVAQSYYESTDDSIKHRHASKISKKMSADFTDICHSIDNFIFADMPENLKLKQDQAKFKVYKHYLFNPYREKIASSGSAHIGLLLEAFNIMIHSKKELAQGKNLDHFA